jgi:outer membrane lipoprotein-sorting protein
MFMVLSRPLVALSLLIALALPATAQQALSLGEVSRYLNTLTTAQTPFTQVNSDGSTSTGTLFLKRPGRARFEYDAPAAALVITGGGQVAIFDSKSDIAPQQFPLRRTPLNLILARKVDLTRAEMVTGLRRDGSSTVITAQDPEHPEYGSIDLIFSSNPTTLRQWVITDEGGGQTNVMLGSMTKGMPLSAFLFDITYEIKQRQR